MTKKVRRREYFKTKIKPTLSYICSQLPSNVSVRIETQYQNFNESSSFVFLVFLGNTQIRLLFFLFDLTHTIGPYKSFTILVKNVNSQTFHNAYVAVQVEHESNFGCVAFKNPKQLDHEKKKCTNSRCACMLWTLMLFFCQAEPNHVFETRIS